MAKRWKKSKKDAIALMLEIVAAVVLIVGLVGLILTAKTIGETVRQFVSVCSTTTALELSVALGSLGVLLAAGEHIPILRKLSGHTVRHQRGLSALAFLGALFFGISAAIRHNGGGHHNSKGIVTASVYEPKPTSTVASPPNGAVPAGFHLPTESPKRDQTAKGSHGKGRPLTLPAIYQRGLDANAASYVPPASYTPPTESRTLPSESSTSESEPTSSETPESSRTSLENATTAKSSSSTPGTSASGEAHGSITIEDNASSPTSVTSQTQMQSESQSESQTQGGTQSQSAAQAQSQSSSESTGL